MKRLLPLFLAAFALAAAAADYKSMWITDVLTGRTVGPVVNKPGNRFSAGGSEWIVLQAGRGEVNFADAKTLVPQGPYGLVEQRMFELGETAYVFTRVADYEGSTPAADESTVSQAERAPAGKGRHSWSGDLPERWVLAPLPSTNPGAHKEPARTWHLDTLEVAPSVTVWAEPLREDPYDWELGGLSGSRDAKLETRRVGVSGFWEGFFAEAAYVTAGKCSGSLVPDGLSISSLKLDGGSGWHAAGGYKYAVVIDGGWSASVSAYVSWDSLSVDLSASTTKKTKIPVESGSGSGSGSDAESGSGSGSGSESSTNAGSGSGSDAGGSSGGSSSDTAKKVKTADGDGSDAGSGTADAGNAVDGYAFEKWSTSPSLDEWRAGVGVGLQYDDWYWGLEAKILVDCWTDTSLDAKVPVLSDEFKLEAERSRPVGVRLGAWYCPADNWFFEGSLTLSSETALRLGVGLFF